MASEQDDRQRILMSGGARLNWLGDYLGNPDIKWEERDIALDEIEFTGNDKFLIDVCNRSPKKFRELVLADPELKTKYTEIVSCGDETVLVRRGDKPNKYKILDGIHRLMGAALSDKKTVKVLFPINEDEVLPFCEAHTIYDLIRGYQRHARDGKGEKELYSGLKLLIRCYGNAGDLLKNRFNKNYVNDEKVQAIIKIALKDSGL